MYCIGQSHRAPFRPGSRRYTVPVSELHTMPCRPSVRVSSATDPGEGPNRYTRWASDPPGTKTLPPALTGKSGSVGTSVPRFLRIFCDSSCPRTGAPTVRAVCASRAQSAPWRVRPGTRAYPRRTRRPAKSAVRALARIPARPPAGRRSSVLAVVVVGPRPRSSAVRRTARPGQGAGRRCPALSFRGGDGAHQDATGAPLRRMGPTEIGPCLGRAAPVQLDRGKGVGEGVPCPGLK